MGKTNKVTLSDLLARREQSKLDKFQVKIYESKELDGKIEVHKMPVKKYLQMTESVDEESSGDSIDYMNKIIFECCPLFRENSKSLLEAYSVGEPIDLPVAIFNDNIGEMQKVIELIQSFYGLTEVQEDIKN